MKVSEKQTETSCCTGPSCTSTNQTEEIPEKTSSCCGTDKGSSNDAIMNAEEQKMAGQTLDSFTYQIRGMDCPSCAATIEKNLHTVKGIESVNVNYSAGKLRVDVSDSSVIDQIPIQVKKLGFEADAIETKKDGQVYRVDGMDCGSCAATIEKHLSKNPSVEHVKVNFSTGKMQILHTAEDKEIIQEVERAGFQASLISKDKKIEEKTQKRITASSVAGLFLATGFFGSFAGLPDVLVTILYALTIVIGGYKPARSAYYAVKSKSLDMNVLMVSAAIGAALIGEWFEGATVVWLFALGNALQNRSIERTRESIRGLINLAPSEALVKVGSQLIVKPVEEVAVGDAIVVKPGEKIPLDGEILSGASSVNQAPITGESLPVDKEKDDSVYAGTINESGSLEIRVTKLVEDTTIAKIIHLVEEAQEQKAPTQAFVDRFARVYTPIVFTLALLVMVAPPLTGFGTWEEWLYKGLALLVVACPCALVISTPVAIVSAIGNAAKNGVLIKGGTFLEKAGAINAIAFDKTGTLTEGKPKVSEVVTVDGSEEELISIARTIEEHSVHPIAKAIISYASEQNISVKTGDSFKAIPGKGAQATIDGVDYFAGNPKLYQEMDVSLSAVEDHVQTLQDEGHTLIVIGTRTEVLGMIGVADPIRSITVSAIQQLKDVGMEEMVMLTGDNNGTAKKIGAQTGVDRYFAELLPEDKVTAVKKLQQEGKKVAMIGDGINDAPALATADLGIAMGGAGTDTAMETADIVLMADNLEKLPHTIRLSRKALTIIKQNVWFSLLTKVAALLLIFPGLLTLWMAVLADTGAALLVILNSMRLLRQK
ncbi:cadmium-translocating P-type ATPase [Planococcus sp. CP5-4]|uniref:heavy metal translocating P-type ATPase n=1 Tax=unclassified Planococcus (in: firmicutes) TaxID=2662419 RepID=UPI001C233382|nr:MULTISPECIES: heavy metal translocating P-type ATPase [unclassified Planococcus (in: firmicutes)]MBU9673377.1 cadmium-translocating P-type ATPase [Planococcus sp. CP5-4_YE]MBV0908150.1 cadmium-translocating P-type ATPase [Planococcus sp. CP5-4_UN]MBW6062211.1 cadmium-translocating P-type ATPase [Planococcus sp. CP5-4]